MATFKRLPSGNWRAQIRRDNTYVSDTFRRYRDAEEWALSVERRIDMGETPTRRTSRDSTTLGELIDLHKRYEGGEQGASSHERLTLGALKQKLGKVKPKDLTRERIIQFAKDCTGG